MIKTAIDRYTTGPLIPFWYGYTSNPNPPQILPMGHVPEGYHLHISLPVAYGITETQVYIAFMSSYSFCVPVSLDLSQYIGAILWVSHTRGRDSRMKILMC